MRFVVEESINEQIPEEFSNREGMSDVQRRFLAWLDDNIGLVKKEGYSSKRLMIKFLSDNHDLLRDDIDWSSLKHAAAVWYGNNLSATESVDTTPDKELAEEFKRLKKVLNDKGYEVMIDQSDFYPNEFMVTAAWPEEIEKITDICKSQLGASLLKQCDLSKYFGLGIAVFRFTPPAAASEDCGGAAAGAPGMGCGTSGIGGVADASSNVGGVPATIGVLEIPSPVVPKKKKKKGSSEAVKKPINEFAELTKKYKNRYLVAYYNTNSCKWILLHSYATEEEARANYKYDLSAATMPGKSMPPRVDLVAPDGTVIADNYDKPITEGIEDNIPEENKNGDCFQAAWRAFYQNISKSPLLVHGIITGQGPIEGIKYNHAWVEIGDTVIDKTIPLFAKGFPKDAYYRLANADEDKVFKYNAKEVAKKAQEFETYGPWESILWQYP